MTPMPEDQDIILTASQSLSLTPSFVRRGNTEVFARR
jgi:hypothetical protein